MNKNTWEGCEYCHSGILNNFRMHCHHNPNGLRMAIANTLIKERDQLTPSASKTAFICVWRSQFIYIKKNNSKVVPVCYACLCGFRWLSCCFAYKLQPARTLFSFVKASWSLELSLELSNNVFIWVFIYFYFLFPKSLTACFGSTNGV